MRRNPFYHEKSGKIILTGHVAWYGDDGRLLSGRQRSPMYAVYDREKRDFSPYKAVKMPDGKYFSSGAGCTQILQTVSRELLIPIAYWERGEGNSAVMRCAFDGEEITVIEIGNGLTVSGGRGLCEPSLTEWNGEYFLTLRNDERGYVARSGDGIGFCDPTPLIFDNGEELGSYSTQQHWLRGGDGLYLIYTRRAENNGHIFRHRAPLFIARFDTDRMCVVRDSERIAVPERGARLGNFGAQSYSDEIGYIFASEWMQNDPYGWDKCAEGGSDNSIFVCRVLYN